MREVGGVDLSAGWDRRVSVFGSMIGMEASVCGNRQKWKQKKARDSRDGMANKAPKMVEATMDSSQRIAW
jgi:hypothetical protein